MPKQKIFAKKYQIYYPKGLLPEPYAWAIPGAAHKLDPRRLECLANKFEVGRRSFVQPTFRLYSA